MPKDADIKSDYLEAWRQAWHGWQAWVHQAREDMLFYLNEQLSNQEKAWLKQEGREAYVFNKVARFVDLLSGFEIKDRHILKIQPYGEEDDTTSSQHTGVIMTQMNSNDGYDVMSDAFKYGTLVTGANLVEIFPDRRTGDAHFGRLAYNEFLPDPAFTKRDLSDSQFLLRGKWLTTDQAEFLLPGREVEVNKITPIAESLRWSLLPNQQKLFGRDMRLYEEFWRQDTRKQRMVVIRDDSKRPVRMESEDSFIQRANLSGFTKKQARDFIRNVPNLSTFSRQTNTVRLSVFLDGNLMFDGPNPTGLDDYNFVFVGGVFAPEMDRDDLKLQGLVRRAKDPQSAMNRRMNQMIDIVESQLQTWKRVREGSLVDPDAAFGSGQGKVVTIKRDALGPLSEHFDQLGAPDIPAGLFNLFNLLDKTETETVGLNTEIFGTDDKDISGILSKQRTANALIGHQGLLSGYRLAKKHLGRKLVRYNQLNLTPQKVFRMLNEQPTPQFYSEDYSKYDCVPVEGILTDTQRQLWYLELRSLRSEFPDFAQIITPMMLINAAPMQLKHKFLQELQQAQQQARQQAQQALQQQQRDIELQEGITATQIAKAKEDIANAAESRADTALTRVKTAAEIENLRSVPVERAIDQAIKLEQIRSKGGS
jgi:hypothetical protein